MNKYSIPNIFLNEKQEEGSKLIQLLEIAVAKEKQSLLSHCSQTERGVPFRLPHSLMSKIKRPFLFVIKQDAFAAQVIR